MTTSPSSSTTVPALPSKRKTRTIVLCFDGTSNEYDDTVRVFPFPSSLEKIIVSCHRDVPQNTNVVKLYSILKKDKVEDQVCYYQVSTPFLASNSLIPS